MKMTQGDLKQILDLIGTAEDFVPVFEAIKEKAPVLEPYLDQAVSFLTEKWVDVVVSTVKKFEEKGFTHAEAVMFTFEFVKQVSAKK